MKTTTTYTAIKVDQSRQVQQNDFSFSETVLKDHSQKGIKEFSSVDLRGIRIETSITNLCSGE